VPFIVNDDPVLAADVGADGVHLGADDPSPELARRVLGDRAIIGISCYNDVERAVRLASGAADYVAFGAFFPTTSKMPRAHATPETLRAARPRLSVPVVAIGGITPENGAALVEAGADLLAVISGLYHVADPLSQVRRFQQLFSQRSESLP
jgi:thiamine-phosphate pyrophosphorylase